MHLGNRRHQVSARTLDPRRLCRDLDLPGRPDLLNPAVANDHRLIAQDYFLVHQQDVDADERNRAGERAALPAVTAASDARSTAAGSRDFMDQLRSSLFLFSCLQGQPDAVPSLSTVRGRAQAYTGPIAPRN